MKAISLKQPWANMIAARVKTIETRKWKTSYRGTILICASMNVDSSFDHDWPTQPVGVAVALAEIVDCRPMVAADEKDACCAVYPRANSWVLANIVPIKPFSVRGALGVFDVDIDSSMIQPLEHTV